jgi:hypothetical protein
VHIIQEGRFIFGHFLIMSRTFEAVEAEIQAVKDANPNWITNAIIMGYLTELMREKNSRIVIPAPAGKSPSNVISIQQ